MSGSMRGGRPSFDGAALQNSYNNDLENVKSGGGSFGIFVGLPKKPWVKTKEGTQHTLRFKPWQVDGVPKWFLEAPVHGWVGPEGNKRSYLCRKHVGDTCLLCQELTNNAGSKFYYNVDELVDGAWVDSYMEFNSKAHAALCAPSESINPDTGAKTVHYFMHPDTGCNVAFKMKKVQNGDFKWNEPSAIGYGTPSELPTDRWDKTVNLHDHTHAFSNDELNGAMIGNHPSVEASDTPSTEPADARTLSRQPATVVEEQANPRTQPETVAEVRRPIDEPKFTRDAVVEKKCSKGLRFGNTLDHMKHEACQSCDEKEYQDCANIVTKGGIGK